MTSTSGQSIDFSGYDVREEVETDKGVLVEDHIFPFKVTDNYGNIVDNMKYESLNGKENFKYRPVMQNDGNFVIYDDNNHAIAFETGTSGKGEPPFTASLVENDFKIYSGSFQIYSLQEQIAKNYRNPWVEFAEVLSFEVVLLGAFAIACAVSVAETAETIVQLEEGADKELSQQYNIFQKVLDNGEEISEIVPKRTFVKKLNADEMSQFNFGDKSEFSFGNKLYDMEEAKS